MSASTLVNGPLEERRSRRMPFEGQFRYCDDLEESGRASWCSIGEDGACIRIGRYLRPGRRLMLLWNSATLFGRIVWCKPTNDGLNYVAGVKIFSEADSLGFVVPTLRTA